MATLRTMNRRKYRKANKAKWVTHTFGIRADWTPRAYCEAVRGGRWVRFSPMLRKDTPND